MISELLGSFETSIEFIKKSVADLSEEQMVLQPPGVPNHGMWTVGHIIMSCQGIAVELGAEKWLPEDWESQFGYGSTPSSDVSDYRPKQEMLEILDDSVNRVCRAIRAADESVLKKPLSSHPDPPTSDEKLPTMGNINSASAGISRTGWLRGSPTIRTCNSAGSTAAKATTIATRE